MHAVPPCSPDCIRAIVNRGFQSNSYFLKVGAGGDCVIVDPGLDREAIEQELAACGWSPKAVLCTHGHFDHVGSAAWVQSTYGVPVHLCAADLRLAKLSNFMLAAFKLGQRIQLPEFDLINDGDPQFSYGERVFTFHAMPGHTPGSAGIAVDDLFFSGDSLYARRTSLSRLPGEDHHMLRASLLRLFGWIEGYVRVFPGHGGSATIEDIKLNNEELRAFMATA